jgi:hypothetical protein
MKEVNTPEPGLDRREFTAKTVLALLSGVAVTISACGDDRPTSPSPTPTPNPSAGGSVTGTVEANHGHSAVITGAQLSAGNAVVLDIRGSATHPHTVELTAGEVMQIASRQRVSKSSSSDDGHTHTVTFNG